MSSTKAIGEQLAVLLKLQEIDRQIYSLTQTREEKPKELEAFRQKCNAQKMHVSDIEKELTTLQVKRKEKEVELESKEENIKKYQVQLYQVKTNKEYQSLQNEIEVLKADKAVLEEDVLVIMEEGDQKKESLAKEKETLSRKETELVQEEKKITQEISQIEQELASLREKRQNLAPEVEQRLFVQYDRISAGKRGLALAPVEGDACGGCHMNLPPQVINEVQLEERVIVCENCSRILYERSHFS